MKNTKVIEWFDKFKADIDAFSTLTKFEKSIFTEAALQGARRVSDRNPKEGESRLLNFGMHLGGTLIKPGLPIVAAGAAFMGVIGLSVAAGVVTANPLLTIAATGLLIAAGAETLLAIPAKYGFSESLSRVGDDIKAFFKKHENDRVNPSLAGDLLMEAKEFAKMKVSTNLIKPKAVIKLLERAKSLGMDKTHPEEFITMAKAYAVDHKIKLPEIPKVNEDGDNLNKDPSDDMDKGYSHTKHAQSVGRVLRHEQMKDEGMDKSAVFLDYSEVNTGFGPSLSEADLDDIESTIRQFKHDNKQPENNKQPDFSIS